MDQYVGLHGASPDTEARPTKRTVVVIEDNDDLRDTMPLVLETAGHAASLASDGARGLDLLLETRPDVAFIDLGLPVLDGYEVARRARELLGESITRTL